VRREIVRREETSLSMPLRQSRPEGHRRGIEAPSRRPACLSMVFVLTVLISSQGKADHSRRGSAARQLGAFQALVAAVERDDIAAVRTLISHGVDVDGKRISNSATDRPLLRAARRGNLEMVETLLSAGANPDWCCCSCVTALHEAIRRQYVEMVRRLIDAGASVRLLCDGKTAPITLAQRTGNEELVRLLSDRLAVVETQQRRQPEGVGEEKLRVKDSD
jgi:hypothetical protein